MKLKILSKCVKIQGLIKKTDLCWKLHRIGAHIYSELACAPFLCEKSILDGWMGGWIEVKAWLRIANNNQKSWKANTRKYKECLKDATNIMQKWKNKTYQIAVFKIVFFCLQDKIRSETRYKMCLHHMPQTTVNRKYFKTFFFKRAKKRKKWPNSEMEYSRCLKSGHKTTQPGHRLLDLWQKCLKSRQKYLDIRQLFEICTFQNRTVLRVWNPDLSRFLDI